MANLREFGPATNATFFNKYLSRNDCFEGLILKNLNHHPYTGQWDATSAPTMAYILYYTRSKVNNSRPDKTDIVTICMAEFLGSYVHANKFKNEDEARAEFTSLVRNLICDTNLLNQIAPTVNRDTWLAMVQDADYAGVFNVTVVANYGNPVDADWPDNPEAGWPNLDSAMRLLFYIASRAQRAMKLTCIDVIINITVSICKRGIVSEQFINKITSEIHADLNQTPIVDADIITKFYHSIFRYWINDEHIADIMRMGEDLIPPQALRLKLTVTQLVTNNSGLTSFVTIGRAIRKYTDFPWWVIAAMYPDDVKNFKAAVVAVNGSPYYSLKKDLGPARSPNFPRLAFIAKELLIQVGGETSLRRFRGWSSRIPLQNEFQLLLEQYIMERNKGVGGEAAKARNRDETAIEGENLVVLVQNEINDQMFA